jgi:hypothetical protein
MVAFWLWLYRRRRLNTILRRREDRLYRRLRARSMVAICESEGRLEGVSRGAKTELILWRDVEEVFRRRRSKE